MGGEAYITEVKKPTETTQVPSQAESVVVRQQQVPRTTVSVVPPATLWEIIKGWFKREKK